MRPTNEELVSLFDELNEKYFQGLVSKVPIVINERMTSSAGRASWGYKFETKSKLVGLQTRRVTVKKCIPKKIEISGPVFDHNGWSHRRSGMTLTELENTMAHEMTHIYLAEHFGDEGHSSNFHKTMSRITGVNGNHRCHSMRVSGVTANKKVRPQRNGKVSNGFSLGSLIK